MRRYDFCKEDYDVVKVICEYDGEIKYCKSLYNSGLCKCSDYTCPSAIAVIATKKGVTKYLELRNY